jgi:hypothetical protein
LELTGIGRRPFFVILTEEESIINPYFFSEGLWLFWWQNQKATHMKLTDQSLTVFFFLFLLFATQIAAFGQAEVFSDSLEIVTEDDSVELSEDGFQEVVQEKFIEENPSWLGLGRFFILFYLTGVLFWIVLILFLCYRLSRYFLKLISGKKDDG